MVSGAPGTGKSTVARELGAALRRPVLSLDPVKEALADVLGLGASTHRTGWATRRPGGVPAGGEFPAPWPKAGGAGAAGPGGGGVRRGRGGFCHCDPELPPPVPWPGTGGRPSTAHDHPGGVGSAAHIASAATVTPLRLGGPLIEADTGRPGAPARPWRRSGRSRVACCRRVDARFGPEPGHGARRPGPAGALRRRVDRARGVDPAALRPGRRGELRARPDGGGADGLARGRACRGRAGGRGAVQLGQHPARVSSQGRVHGSSAGGRRRSSSTRRARSPSGCGTGPCWPTMASCAPGCRPGATTAVTRGGSGTGCPRGSGRTRSRPGGTASRC